MTLVYKFSQVMLIPACVSFCRCRKILLSPDKDANLDKNRLCTLYSIMYSVWLHMLETLMASVSGILQRLIAELSTEVSEAELRCKSYSRSN